MVKTEVIENFTKEVITYPLIAKILGTVVLFTENNVGTVLQASIYPVGHYSDQWSDIKLWTILPKGVKVVLENS